MGCREPLRDLMRHDNQILGVECTGCIEVVAEMTEKKRKPAGGDCRWEWTSEGSAQAGRES